MTFQRFNYGIYHKLNKSERYLINYVLRLSDIERSYNLDLETEASDLLRRYDILFGEIQIGNDNPNLKEELKSVTVQLIDLKAIPFIHGQKQILQLSVNSKAH